MKYFLESLFFVCLIGLVSSKSYTEKWIEWKNGFNKTYISGRQSVSDDSQEQVRFMIFKEKLKLIEAHNAKNVSFKMGTNIFSDLTESELESLVQEKLDIKKIEKNIQKANRELFQMKRAVEDSVDWVADGYVTPARDQGKCGACYAFSAASVVESIYGIKNNLKNSKLKKFSEQQLLDCTYYAFYNSTTKLTANLGCNGGYMYYSFFYLTSKSIQPLKSYPYVGEVKSCKYKANFGVTKVSGVFTPSYKVGDHVSIKNVVSMQPISSHMYVASDFYNYESGIYFSDLCSSNLTSCPKGVNHAVTIVGYGSENGRDYWLVKNSWGPTFGQNGFFKIVRGKNMCCIEGYSYYAKL